MSSERPRRRARRPTRIAVLAAFSVFAALASARAAESLSADADPDAAAARPYLSADAMPDDVDLLRPPPAEGSPEARSDLELYAATRALAGTPRWALATHDANRAPNAVWHDFSCALGADIPAERVPRVVALLGRINADVEQSTRAVKGRYKRPRPLVGNDAPICVPRNERFVASYSYPSGHATQGWATAFVLSELAPDRAAALMRRGRTFGESRIVCGAHWGSDVEAGRTAATALVAVLNADPDFRADLGDARRELESQRIDHPSGLDPSACRVESETADAPLR